jgi:hypothetical protein
LHTYGGVSALPFQIEVGRQIRYVGFGGVEAASSGYVDNFKLTTTLAPSLKITTQLGRRIYKPPFGATLGYRYGPTIFIDPANKNHISMWTSAEPVSGNQDVTWDSIRYRDSTNGGLTWTETTALEPTPGGYDQMSCCDPGVVKIGQYYYLGYTTGRTAGGLANDAMVARSTSPNSGFEKWNGTGWGGNNPQPFVKYEGPADKWGVGTPSFVVKDGTLYAYYSYTDKDGIGGMALSTVSASDANWPAHLTFRGYVENDNTGAKIDVKYIDAYHKFIGVTVDESVSAASTLHFWESTDGLVFSSIGEITGNYTQDWALGVGISGRPDGHLDLSDNNFVAYAYSPGNVNRWGLWSTYMNPITISLVPEPGTFSLLCAGALALLPVLRCRRKNRKLVAVKK